MLLILSLRARISVILLPVEGDAALGGGDGAMGWPDKDESLNTSAKTAPYTFEILYQYLSVSVLEGTRKSKICLPGEGDWNRESGD